MSQLDKCIIASKKENIAETYVTVENINNVVQKLVAQDASVTEVRVLGFQLSDEDAQALAYGITESKLLKALSIDQLHLGDAGAKNIAQGLCYNESLTYLSMRWNEIGPDGGVALAESLHYNKSIKHMVLSFNNIGKKGGCAFATAIKANSALESLHLKWNNIDNVTGDTLLDAMSENRGALTSLLLGGNGSSLRNARKGVVRPKDANRSVSKRFLSMRKNRTEVESMVSLDQLRKDLGTPIDDDEEEEVEETHEFEVGDRVECSGEPGQSTRVGTIRFIGGTEFQREGIWYGVEFDSPVGKNNGTVNGVQYFSCIHNHGSFLREDKLTWIPE